jgi:hypothetical protein
MASRSRAWIRTALIATLFTGLAVVNSYPLAFGPAARIGHHGDALFSVWRLAWVGHQLRADPRHLFDANIFYPEPRTLAYSDAVLLPAVVLAPLQWSGIPAAAIYNLALLAAFVLNALAAYALVRRLAGSVAAGILAGVVYGFAPFRFDHFDHIEMQFSFWLPLATLAWHRAVTSHTIRGYAAVAALATAQVLSCIYYGIFLLTWLPVITGVWFVRTPLKVFKACVWMLLPPLVVLAVYSLPYLGNREHLGERHLRDVQSWSARISDFRSAPSTNVVYGWTHRFSVPERYLLPGFVATALLAVALWPPWDRVRVLHAAGLAFAFQLAIGFNGLIYPLLYEWLLPYRGLRVPARATVLVLLGTCVLAGFGLVRLTARVKRRLWANVIAGALIAVVCGEYLSRPVLRELENGISPWYRTLRAVPDAVLFEWPVTVPWRLEQMVDVRYMYRSTWHWRPLLNGYSGNYPASYTELLLTMRSFPDTGSLEYLQRRGATVLVVHEVAGSRPSYEYAVDRLGRDPRVRLWAQDTDAGSRVTFFRLSPEAVVPGK